MSTGEFWFNMVTRQVEEGKVSPGADRMGPYASAEEAAQAFEIARERTEAADEADRDWADED